VVERGDVEDGVVGGVGEGHVVGVGQEQAHGVAVMAQVAGRQADLEPVRIEDDHPRGAEQSQQQPARYASAAAHVHEAAAGRHGDAPPLGQAPEGTELKVEQPAAGRAVDHPALQACHFGQRQSLSHSAASLYEQSVRGKDPNGLYSGPWQTLFDGQHGRDRHTGLLPRQGQLGVSHFGPLRVAYLHNAEAILEADDAAMLVGQPADDLQDLS